jgi:hypothetical protein
VFGRLLPLILMSFRRMTDLDGVTNFGRCSVETAAVDP